MKDWNDIVGQKNIVGHLRRTVSEKRPSHAYIFHGDDGIGKRTLADIFVKSLQCEHAGECGDGASACGKCRSCLQFDSGNHPDVFRVTHEKTVISVDDIRKQIIEPMSVRPYSSIYKIFIVDEAEKMNEQAQNALLKTLEEPPEYGIIILLSNNINIFLDTIRSRVVSLPFMPAPASEIKKFLMKEKHIPDYQAGIAAGSSGGCPGLAWVWADSEEFAERREKAEKILKKLGNEDAAECFSLAKEWAKNKAEVDFFLRMAENWIRDVLFVKTTGKKNVSMFHAEWNCLKEQAQSLDYEYFTRLLKNIDELRERLKYNVSTEIAISEFLRTL